MKKLFCFITIFVLFLSACPFITNAINMAYCQNHNAVEGTLTGSFPNYSQQLVVDYPTPGGTYLKYAPFGSPSYISISSTGKSLRIQNTTYFSSLTQSGWSYPRIKTPVQNQNAFGSTVGATIDFQLKMDMTPIRSGYDTSKSPVGLTGFIVDVCMTGINKEFYLCVAKYHDGSILVTSIGGDRNDINNQYVNGCFIQNCDLNSWHRYTFKYSGTTSNTIYFYFDGVYQTTLGSPAVRSMPYSFDFAYCSLVNRNINAHYNSSNEIEASTTAYLDYLHIYNTPLTPSNLFGSEQLNAPYGGLDWKYVLPYSTRNISSGYKRPDRPDHYSIDLPVANGTGVLAPENGQIQMFYPEGTSSAGNYIILRTESCDPYSGNKIRVGFMHLHSYDSQHPQLVNVGDYITKGTQIAYTSDTGAPGAYHLDLSMWRMARVSDSNWNWKDASSSINPQRFFPNIRFTGKTSDQP